MNSRTQRSLPVRVEYEPNRFSTDCLRAVYEQLHPTDSRRLLFSRNEKINVHLSRKKTGART